MYIVCGVFNLSWLWELSCSCNMSRVQVQVDPTTIVFNLDTLEPETNDPQNNNTDVTPNPSNEIYDEFIDNIGNDNGSNFDSDLSDFENGEDFYQIDTDSDNEDLPSYPITNMQMTMFDNDLPEFLHYNQDDQLNDWDYEEIDSGPSCGPFQGNSRTNISDPDGKPEVFLNSLFDDRMWTVLADSTNMYARSKSTRGGGNQCLDPTHPEYKKHCHLNAWSDCSTGDIKMFLAHILIMGLVKKPDLEKYWNTNTKAKVPFFWPIYVKKPISILIVEFSCE